MALPTVPSNLAAMESAASAPASLFSKGRLEALSDGVFAVVMTLLVLEIKPELERHADDAAVIQMLHQLARPFVAYSIAFTVSAVFWIQHHRKFSLVRHVNGAFASLTLAFLFTLSLLPLSVAIYTKSLSNHLTLALFYGNFALMAVIMMITWIYARAANLVRPDAPPREIKRTTVAIGMLCIFGIVISVGGFFSLTYAQYLVVPIAIVSRVWQRRLSRASA
jgi:uncharacterized membrane protein